jgi:hypothetical protein
VGQANLSVDPLWESVRQDNLNVDPLWEPVRPANLIMNPLWGRDMGLCESPMGAYVSG